MKTQSNNCPICRIDSTRLIEKTAVALGELGILVYDLEEALIGSLHDARLDQNKALLAQDIDLISQTVSELNALLARMALHTPNNLHLSVKDIVEPIKLERLRQLILSEGKTVQGLRRKHPEAMQLFE
jgi:hypothetical protein